MAQPTPLGVHACAPPESDGLVLLMLGVQAGRVFLGYPAGHIDSRIAGQSDTTCLNSSTVVRIERWKVMK